MSDRKRAKALDAIRRNIQRSGFHIYFVEQHSTPRFVYTIGLTESIGAELVFAGGIAYFGDDVLEILHSLRSQLAEDSKRATSGGDPVSVKFDRVLSVQGRGTFRLTAVAPSWSRAMLLGAIDYYKGVEITAYQVVPDKQHWTVDVPDMSVELSPAAEPVWRWLIERWNYPFPETSTATTNLAALRGDRVTEVARWEKDEWDMFAGPGPDVTEEEMRVVPVGCLVGPDPSLALALDLKVGGALWRDPEGGSWNVWEKST